MKRWDDILVAVGLRDLPLRDDEARYRPFKRTAPCPKCGFDGVEGNYDGHSTTFVPARVELRVTCRLSCPERMLRRCRRCGAEWFELPVDAGKAAT